MKNSYAAILFFSMLILALQPFVLTAQITCDDPLILIQDDIEAYTEGDATGQAPHWIQWPGTDLGAIVTSDLASSGTQSIKIDGTEDGQDALLVLGDSVQGHYLLRFDMFVPAGSSAYFNMQHEAPTSSAGFWGFDVFFDGDGTGRIDVYDDEVSSFDYPEDVWFEVYFWADIDNDQARINIDEYTRRAWPFTAASGDPSNGLNSINFFPINEDHLYYVDNIDFWQIPTPETGQYCYTAVPATVGTNSVLSIDCYGGGYDIGGNGSGKKGYWFTYTPEEDGIISIASCNEGVDTRGWIFVGDCQGLEIVGVNDDQCPISEGGSEWASYREAIVSAGNTYYIMWDDAWEDTTFDFELTFTTDDPTPGDFCQSAIAVEPGEHIVEEMDGDAAVAGPNINNTSASTTNYAQSEWYSFTPTAPGTMTVSSCDGAGSDTHVYIYTGDCATFSTLDLVAQSNNSEDCSGLQSQVSMEVEAGETYYIEWIDRWEEAAFFWFLIFEPNEDVVTVTFQVDMQMEAVSPEGVFLSGSFNGWPDPGAPMVDMGNDIWELAIAVEKNSEYEYKFQNGTGGWEDISDPESLCTTGDFGNRLLVVEEENIALEEVCFNSCVACIIDNVSESVLSTGLNISPNPAKDLTQLQFDLSERLDNVHLQIYNVLGNKVYQQQLGDIQNQSIDLDLSHLSAGTYLIQVFNTEEQITKKIIIE
jgi:hypothetical protein